MKITVTILSIAVIALFVMLILQRCNNHTPVVQQPRADTSAPRTVFVQQPAITLPTTQPIIVQSQPAQNIPLQYVQLSGDIKELSKQVQELASKFYAVNSYQDSIVLHDSTGANVGVVKLQDLVSENIIKQRSPSYQLRLPITYQTITIHEPYKAKRQVFIGGEVLGSTAQLVSAIGAGAVYKDRQDRIFKIGAQVGMDGRLQYGLGSYWKIKLKH